MSLSESYLVDERSKAVVEGLDLLFLLGADNLDAGVDLQVEGLQQALVYCHSSDLRWHEAPARASTVATTEASTKTCTAAIPHAIASTHSSSTSTSTDAAAAEAVAAATATATATHAHAQTTAEPRANTRYTCALHYAHPAGASRDRVGRLAGETFGSHAHGWSLMVELRYRESAQELAEELSGGVGGGRSQRRVKVPLCTLLLLASSFYMILLPAGGPARSQTHPTCQTGTE